MYLHFHIHIYTCIATKDEACLQSEPQCLYKVCMYDLLYFAKLLKVIYTCTQNNEFILNALLECSKF